MWKSLCKLLDLPQFSHLGEEIRSTRAKEIDPFLRQAIARQPYARFYEQLQAESIAFGPVMGPHQVLEDPQMASRGMTQSVTGTDGPKTYLLQPISMDGSKGFIRCPPPALGQHNGDLLSAKNELSVH